MFCWDSDGLNWMSEKPSLTLGPLPVVTKTDEPSVAGLDQILAPYLGLVQKVFRSAPVAWLYSLIPARTSGLSHSELIPT